MDDIVPDPVAADLVALVGSRIAHDLISPLGAISNGLELLNLTAAGETPEMALIAESVDNANIRIRLFRIAFGAARPGAVVAESELRSVLAPGADGRKLAVDWQPTGDPPRAAAKLALLSLMCLESAMPWGGQVAVRRSGESWQLTACAERQKIDQALWAHLGNPAIAPGDILPAQVHFALLPREARAQGRTLDVTRTDAAITIAF